MKTNKQTPTQSQQVKPNPTDRRKEIGQSQDEGSQSHSSKLMKQTLTADTIQTPTQIASEIMKELKVTPEIKLEEFFKLDGSFFYIHKKIIKPYLKSYDYEKYYIKKVVDKKQIEMIEKIYGEQK